MSLQKKLKNIKNQRIFISYISALLLLPFVTILILNCLVPYEQAMFVNYLVKCVVVIFSSLGFYIELHLKLQVLLYKICFSGCG